MFCDLGAATCIESANGERPYTRMDSSPRLMGDYPRMAEILSTFFFFFLLM